MTYIDTLEAVTDEVAEWAVRVIEEVCDALAPDGRPFEETKRTPEDKVDEYLQVRGNAPAWEEWISNRELAIIQQLLAAGIPEVEMAIINPRKVATAMALQYSNDMEPLVRTVLNGST